MNKSKTRTLSLNIAIVLLFISGFLTLYYSSKAFSIIVDNHENLKPGISIIEPMSLVILLFLISIFYIMLSFGIFKLNYKSFIATIIFLSVDSLFIIIFNVQGDILYALSYRFTIFVILIYNKRLFKNSKDKTEKESAYRMDY